MVLLRVRSEKTVIQAGILIALVRVMFYDDSWEKPSLRISSLDRLATAVQLRFLTMGFQFDVRSRLEAGIDGIAEVRSRA